MPRILDEALKQVKGVEVWLTPRHAEVCALAFEEASQNAAGRIGAFAIMRGHCHVVVHSPRLEGAEVLRRFKGVSARRLSQRFGKPPAITWWTRNGSHRLLPDGPSIRGAIRYVLQQEKPLIVYRAPQKSASIRPDSSAPMILDRAD
ncbi:MAG: transposase [Phycisphaeraceae bacterium]|nr:transposase [Phycisphaeraceae bacterium]